MSAPKLTDKPAESLPVPRILKEVSRRIVGQDAMVERLLVGMLTGGHILLEGVPGLAKTLAVRTLSEIIHASFSRIQFTPDLLPADLIGTMVFDQKTQEFHVKKGPLFAQIILADEINRAPAKVQAALLEAMQEHQVTIGGNTYPLEEPFLVLATQNPIENEGHLSAAGGPARPFHAQGPGGVSQPGRGEGGAPPDERRAGDPGGAGARAAGHPRRADRHCRALHGPEGRGLHRGSGPRHPRARRRSDCWTSSP